MIDVLHKRKAGSLFLIFSWPSLTFFALPSNVYYSSFSLSIPPLFLPSVTSHPNTFPFPQTRRMASEGTQDQPTASYINNAATQTEDDLFFDFTVKHSQEDIAFRFAALSELGIDDENSAMIQSLLQHETLPLPDMIYPARYLIDRRDFHILEALLNKAPTPEVDSPDRQVYDVCRTIQEAGSRSAETSGSLQPQMTLSDSVLEQSELLKDFHVHGDRDIRAPSEDETDAFAMRN